MPRSADVSQPPAPVQTTQDSYSLDKRCAIQIVLVSLEDLGFFGR